MTRFIVDAMLGKLALWLRLAGYDTIYSAEIHDDQLLEIAKNEVRVLITSDAELFERAIHHSTSALLVRGGVDERVATVFKTFDIAPKIDPSRSRCSKCNGELQEIANDEKELVRNLVHDQTYNYYDQFWLCNDCRSVYFQGGQWSNIREYMDRISELIQRGNDS
ncbi:MAG: Mut7-C RNAse domain-containing protein [Candidatus Hodarchaeota archaeon]